MPKGFGLKKQTKDQYIKNFIKTSKALLSGFETPEEAKQYFSKKRAKTYQGTHNDYTIEELLNPVCKNLAIHVNPTSSTPDGRKIAVAGFNGLWRVVLIERPDKSLDLDIGVMSGSTYRFHSEVIKDSIINKFGREIYDQWRSLVMSDINSLQELIEVIRTQIDHVPWSYTCSPSSARLCNRVGISTFRGAAFLFPSSYN